MRPSENAAENRARREIARRFVALCKEYLGRGPTRARTYFDENLVVLVVEDTLTKGERLLAEQQRIDLVRDLRRSLQGAMRAQVAEIVSEETGRRVEAALSDHSVLPDYAVEAFVLEPEQLGEREQPLLPALSTRQAPNGYREISRGMVSLFKDYVGRGPTRARTYVGDDLVVVLLDETLTKAEKTLAATDSEKVVREMRRRFQGAMQEAGIEMIESHLGDRRVEAFLSDSSVDPDYAVEVFLLSEKAPPPATS